VKEQGARDDNCCVSKMTTNNAHRRHTIITTSTDAMTNHHVSLLTLQFGRSHHDAMERGTGNNKAIDGSSFDGMVIM
jgi:hypothetical protein